jgi:hypothetical protein
MNRGAEKHVLPPDSYFRLEGVRDSIETAHSSNVASRNVISDIWTISKVSALNIITHFHASNTPQSGTTISAHYTIMHHYGSIYMHISTSKFILQSRRNVYNEITRLLAVSVEPLGDKAQTKCGNTSC